MIMFKKSLPFPFIFIFIIIFHCDRAKNFAKSFQDDTSEIIMFEKMKTHPERSGWGHGVELWMIRSDGTNLKQLTYGHHDNDPAWSPDRQCIAFSRDNDGIYTIKHDGTDLRRVTGSYICHYPQWLRDNRIFFSASKGPENEFRQKWRLYEIDIDTKQEKMIDLGLPGIFSVRVSPDQKYIAFTAGDKNVYIADIKGKEVRKLKVLESSEEGYPHVWYPDCKYLLVVQGTSCLKVSIDGTKAERIGGVAACNMTWSPDGSRAVYQYNNEIWIMDANGQNKRLLAKPTDDSHYASPVW